MTTLQERLNAAMDYAKKTRADLARACGISRPAVSKWFDSGKNLKMEHLFSVSDECGVDARWLAIGEGTMKPSKAAPCTHQDIPTHRFEMIRTYGRLDPEIRAPIKMLIETLWAANSERVRQHSKEIEKFQEDFKKKNPKPAKATKAKEVE